MNEIEHKLESKVLKFVDVIKVVRVIGEYRSGNLAIGLGQAGQMV